MGAMAKVLELHGRHNRAMSFWKKAAKAGSVQGQFRLGEAFYRGEGDLRQDAEEAIVWLHRCIKHPKIDAPENQELLASAATILGYIYMDGEGTSVDNIQATKWFAVGKANGNKEAE